VIGRLTWYERARILARQKARKFKYMVYRTKNGTILKPLHDSTIFFDRRQAIHPFHLVDPSPWPMLLSFALFSLTISAVAFFHSYRFAFFATILSFLFLLVILSLWWRDVIREATFRGYHTLKVTFGIKVGVVLFIVSEIMFFFSFFWAFFHSSLAPAIEIGGIWPPLHLRILNPYGVPLVNTAILLTSGATITFTHYSLQRSERVQTVYGFVVTLILALLFTAFQIAEYIEAPFNISDGIYGSTFFLTTGFHGLHVIIGTIFILVAFFRFVRFQFSTVHHVGFEAATWYWHFVDVVWLFLFLFVYLWGSLGPS